MEMLQADCRKYGLSQYGSAADLRARLQAYALQRLQASSAAEGPSTPSTTYSTNRDSTTIVQEADLMDFSYSHIESSTPAAPAVVRRPGGIRVISHLGEPSPEHKVFRHVQKLSLDRMLPFHS